MQWHVEKESLQQGVTRREAVDEGTTTWAAGGTITGGMAGRAGRIKASFLGPIVFWKASRNTFWL